MKKICYTALLLFLFSQSFGQLTKKDFKLYLDNIATSDSANHLTKEQLLSAKELSTNFPWLTIKSFVITISASPHNICNMARCYFGKGNNIKTDAKTFLSSVDSGWIVVIDIRGYNRQGVEIDWPAIGIDIK
jgi:hypothetical protein